MGVVELGSVDESNGCQNDVVHHPFQKPDGSRFGPTSWFSAGSPVLKRFAYFRFHMLNRAAKGVGSRSDRFNRPVRSDFQNLGLN
ncbi:hypothetical protein PIB30_001133 [Stylosanthes scabra]|uniref:Uncharacterized protein n=1 Tax=Stylosanthes scabra TaxID=79078 RepID=A0ABU6U4A9_9FABA|nr:hypothetical protein [Stylosanthes scabra]